MSVDDSNQHSSKYLLLCSTEKFKKGENHLGENKWWGILFFFRVNYSFKKQEYSLEASETLEKSVFMLGAHFKGSNSIWKLKTLCLDLSIRINLYQPKKKNVHVHIATRVTPHRYDSIAFMGHKIWIHLGIYWVLFSVH